MRNDARPIGEDAPSSPLGGPGSATDVDARDPAKPIVNRDDSRRVNRDAVNNDAAMPADDATLKTKI